MHGNVVTIVSIGDCMPTCNAGSEIKGHVHLQRMGRSMHGATRQTGVSALSLTQAAVRRLQSLQSGVTHVWLPTLHYRGRQKDLCCRVVFLWVFLTCSTCLLSTSRQGC